ncbi:MULTISPECIES: esterase/lipase family protein [Cupriavidus]
MTPTPPDDMDEVIIPRTRDDQGRRVYRTHLTSRDDQRPKVLLVTLPAPIPVVFLPGIMGTNLRNKKTKEPVWRPPNMGFSAGDILGAIVALFVWWSRGPKRRQALLNPETTEVDDSGPVDVGNSGLPEAAARLRGWGKAHRMGYHGFMARMELELDHILSEHKHATWSREEALRKPADYGEELGKASALSEDDLKKAARYQFDVWCGGYNWLRSNRDSAEDIIDYIDNTVLAYYRENGGISAAQADRMQVIIVTHSMGGLVSRALTQIHRYSKVLGVVHGVQPATGAPAIYHHMRCGYEGISQVVLGANAGEVTAVVANSPGALELTPTRAHRGGQPWLFLRDTDGNLLKDADGRERAYPRDGDPYEEIYKNSAWYGLVPEQNTKFLDMAEKSKNQEQSPRAKFADLIDLVAGLHQELSDAGYHPETYAHYAADDSADRHSWRDVVWQGDVEVLEAPGAVPKDDGNGSYRGWFQVGAPKIMPIQTWWPGQRQDDPGRGGDGTVATDSGHAPGQAGIKASFRHGNLGTGEYNKEQGYEHAASYLDPRAQWAAFYSVAKIAELADWAPQRGGTP